MCEFNWLEIVYAFLGAFFGFLFALGVEYVFSRSQTRKSKEASIHNIQIELENLAYMLKQIETAKDNRLVIDIPIWDALVQSGNVFTFSKEKYYKTLLRTYSMVKRLIEAEKKFEDSGALVPSERLKDKRKGVLKQITTFFEELPQK